jgi:RNA-binding protein 5/10
LTPWPDGHSAAPPTAINDGTRDIGTAPNSIMLLRNLDPLVTEEDIAKAIDSMDGVADKVVSGGGVRKIFVIRDRTTRSSWGFAFVQFADIPVRSTLSPLFSGPL